RHRLRGLRRRPGLRRTRRRLPHRGLRLLPGLHRAGVHPAGAHQPDEVLGWIAGGSLAMSGLEHSRFAALHDVELCALAATGERRAFGELVRRNGSAVRGVLRRMGAHSAEADDVAQDAFLTAFERISEFRGEGTFAGWVKKIAARLYLRRLHRDRRL